MINAEVYIGKICYEDLLDFMNNQLEDDCRGEIMDMDLFYNDKWLLDSAVIDNIVPTRGHWDIFLVFAHHKYPFKLIKKRITKCITLQKAKVTANLMRRLAAKDQRGTLTVNEADFNPCLN